MMPQQTFSNTPLYLSIKWLQNVEFFSVLKLLVVN